MAEHFAPIIRDQKTIIEGIRSRLRDPGQDRWEDPEAYRALNDALSLWAGRVHSPYIYNIVGGISPDEQEYPIPDYITGPMEVQRKSIRTWQGVYLQDDAQYVWSTVNGWTVERASDGDGQLLRLPLSTYRYDNYTEDARIVWPAENGMVPDEVLGLDAGISDSDTSLVIDSLPEVGRFGHLKINNEWIQYSGLSTDAAGLTTLSGLERGVGATVPAAHLADDEVLFGVSVPDMTLFQQLNYQMLASLNSLYITESSATETAHYQWSMRWWQQLADEFWESFMPLTGTTMSLSRGALGGWVQ